MSAEIGIQTQAPVTLQVSVQTEISFQNQESVQMQAFAFEKPHHSFYEKARMENFCWGKRAQEIQAVAAILQKLISHISKMVRPFFKEEEEEMADSDLRPVTPEQEMRPREAATEAQDSIPSLSPLTEMPYALTPSEEEQTTSRSTLAETLVPAAENQEQPEDLKSPLPEMPMLPLSLAENLSSPPLMPAPPPSPEEALADLGQALSTPELETVVTPIAMTEEAAMPAENREDSEQMLRYPLIKTVVTSTFIIEEAALPAENRTLLDESPRQTLASVQAVFTSTDEFIEVAPSPENRGDPATTQFTLRYVDQTRNGWRFWPF